MTIDDHKTTILAFFLGALLEFAAGYSYSANPAPAVVESTQCRSLRLATKAAAGLTKLAEDFETESRLEQIRGMLVEITASTEQVCSLGPLPPGPENCAQSVKWFETMLLIRWLAQSPTIPFDMPDDMVEAFEQSIEVAEEARNELCADE